MNYGAMYHIAMQWLVQILFARDFPRIGNKSVGKRTTKIVFTANFDSLLRHVLSPYHPRKRI